MEPQAENQNAGMARHRIDLFGTAIDVVTEQDTINAVLAGIAHGSGGWIITANLDQLRQCHQTKPLHRFFSGASLVVADGMPLVWAARIQRTPLPERVTGSSLVWSLTEAAATTRISVFLLGGSPGVASRAAKILCANYPGLRLCGTMCPQVGREIDDRTMQDILSSLGASGADLVYVALGFPKQELLIEKLRQLFPSMWFVGVGISLSFVSGDVTRAPKWWQRLGLEWFHRLLQEPARLWSRYMLKDMPFAFRLATHSLRQRFSRQNCQADGAP